MELELREAVLAAAKRVDVRQAVAAVYRTLADAIEVRRPICKTSGRCCRFEEFGHRLYVSTMELAKFVADLPAVDTPFDSMYAGTPQAKSRHALPIFTGALPESAADGSGCRFQAGGLCGVREFRPFGCRIFFCDETSTTWQHEVYEQLHGKLRALHDQMNVPYYYVEWRFALKVCL